MRATALVCVLLVFALVGAAFAESLTSVVRPAAESDWEPSIRVGDCAMTPAERANLDPRLSNRPMPGAAPAAASAVRRDPPCDLACDACWYDEGETVGTDYEDDFNGGCNSIPSVFWTVNPGFGPIRICGQGGNYDYYGVEYRDTDWFEMTFTESREITVSITAEFPVALYLIDGNSGCSSPDIIVFELGEPCVDVSWTYTVAPGTYWIWVSCSEWNSWPSDSDYVLTIEGYDFPCVLDCPGNWEPEGEPLCGTDLADNYNGGCNSTPPVFSTIEPSDVTSYHCGTAGFYEYYGLCYRDTDWYELVLDEPREVEICAVGEFSIQLMLNLADPDCSDYGFVGQAWGETCEAVCINQVLDPGRYWIFIAPQFSEYGYTAPCEARYIFSVDGYTTAVERRSWGLIKSLYR